MEMRIDGVAFEVAKDRDGKDHVSITKRESQRGDPSALHMAEWHVDGPDLTSFEQILFGADSGYLGRDYGINTDGRFEGTDTLGPLINTVTLTTYDNSYSGLKFGTATAKLGSTFRFGNAPAATQAQGAVRYGPVLYIIRQNHIAKVRISTMALERTGVTLDDPATSIIRSTARAPISPDEVAVGMNASPYVVLQGAATHPNSDTWVVNDDEVSQRVFGIAPDRVVGLFGQTVQGNILTGANTMASPNWNTIATLTNRDIQFNSFAMDGNLWVLGTSNGPYMLDSETGEFFPVIDEIDNDLFHTSQMTTWFPIGVVIPLRDGLRQQKNRRGESFGPEVFDWNQSPIQGHTHGVAGTTRWLYTTVHNDIDSSTWLVAWGSFHAGDPVRQQHLLAPHVIARLSSTDVDSQFLHYIGRADGLRTRETLVGGLGPNMFWMTIGLTAREIDDTSYAFAASGTTHLTELRRHPWLWKDIEYFEFESADCTTTETMTAGVSVDGKTAVTLTGDLIDFDGSSTNGVVKTDGMQRIHAILDDGSPRRDFSGYRLKPQMAYARGTTTTLAPKLIGTLRVHYRVRAKQTRQIEVQFELRDDVRMTKEDRAKKLLDLPSPFQVVYNREEFWAAVDDVTVGGDRATMQLTEWHTPFRDRPE